jgi:hypothetical protein
MDNLSGPELVKALRDEYPKLSIENILDKTREILFKRKLKNIGQCDNIFNFLKCLIENDMTRDEIIKATSMHPSGPIQQIDEAIDFISTPQEVEVRSCFPWRVAAKGKKQGTNHLPSL